MKMKLQPYQKSIMDFFASVPEGCSIKFVHGRNSIQLYAMKSGKLTYKYAGDGKWEKLPSQNDQGEEPSDG